jgi:hydroxymethylpyrimidine pyrophosphatase-like HAD family hydrolase
MSLPIIKTMRDTVVCDLDGTLCNVNHRRHFVTGKKRDYTAFHALLREDPVNEWCHAILAAMDAAYYKIVLVSARPKSVLPNTVNWLAEMGVPYNGLYLLREDGDSTPDVDLKRAWLKSYGAENIKFVLDDRTRVCGMWRSEGVACLQCADPKETL